MSEKLSVAQHRRRWAMSTAALMGVGVLGIGTIAFGRYGTIDLNPWVHYIALAAAVFSALAGLAFAFAMAAIESRGD